MKNIKNLCRPMQSVRMTSGRNRYCSPIQNIGDPYFSRHLLLRLNGTHGCQFEHMQQE